jgi:hypothetical protein
LHFRGEQQQQQKKNRKKTIESHIFSVDGTQIKKRERET